MYTLADLKAELRANLFPTGEADNLVAPHNSMFIEALVDMQQVIKCQQVNNVTIVPACNTLWKCGRTVLDKPRGLLKRLAVIDQINQTTGKEDVTAPIDYCSEIEYKQVRYQDLERLISKTLPNWDWFGSCPWLFFDAGFSPDEGDDMRLTDEVVLSAGVDHGTVNRSFGGVPRTIFLSVRGPSPGLLMTASVTGTPSDTGFDFALSGVPDGSGYRLAYEVNL